jgi:hypothetical protein
MNKSIVYFTLGLLLNLFLVQDLCSQVTIGSNSQVNKGSILDIKETDSPNANSTRGVNLPRVGLTEIDQLYPMFDGISDYQNGQPLKIKEDQAHIGLVVYNRTTNLPKQLCPGVYVWIGSQWRRLGRPCALPICEYDIESNITPGYYHHFYCTDSINTPDKALQTCRSSKFTNNDGYNTYTYHLMTRQEFLETWNQKDTDNQEHYPLDTKYYVDYNGWITLGIIHSDGTKEILNDIMPASFSPLFGPPIGGIFEGNHTVRCVRD